MQLLLINQAKRKLGSLVNLGVLTITIILYFSQPTLINPSTNDKAGFSTLSKTYSGKCQFNITENLEFKVLNDREILTQEIPSRTFSISQYELTDFCCINDNCQPVNSDYCLNQCDGCYKDYNNVSFQYNITFDSGSFYVQIGNFGYWIIGYVGSNNITSNCDYDNTLIFDLAPIAKIGNNTNFKYELHDSSFNLCDSGVANLPVTLNYYTLLFHTIGSQNCFGSCLNSQSEDFITKFSRVSVFPSLAGIVLMILWDVKECLTTVSRKRAKGLVQIAKDYQNKKDSSVINLDKR